MVIAQAPHAQQRPGSQRFRPIALAVTTRIVPLLPASTEPRAMCLQRAFPGRGKGAWRRCGNGGVGGRVESSELAVSLREVEVPKLEKIFELRKSKRLGSPGGPFQAPPPASDACARTRQRNQAVRQKQCTRNTVVGEETHENTQEQGGGQYLLFSEISLLVFLLQHHLVEPALENLASEDQSACTRTVAPANPIFSLGTNVDHHEHK